MIESVPPPGAEADSGDGVRVLIDHAMELCRRVPGVRRVRLRDGPRSIEIDLESSGDVSTAETDPEPASGRHRRDS